MQVDSPRKVNDLISNLESIVNCLRAHHHDVEWRDVELGEDLSSFDRVIASLSPFASWGTRYMGGVLWALASHPSVVLAVDDWQVRGIRQSALTLWNRDDYFEKTIWSHWGKNGYGCGPVDYRDTLKKMVRVLAHSVWPFKVLVPAWEGGRLDLLRLPGEIVPYDPSPYMRCYRGYSIHDGTKKRQWICASLTSKSGWFAKQRFEWPCIRYGNVREGQQKLPEAELQRVYNESWGIVSPPHDVSGSGWFRVRFYMAAWAGAVMLCGDEEASVFAIPGRLNYYWPSLKTFESASDEMLQEIAMQQHMQLTEKSWTRARMADVLLGAL